MSQAHPLRQAVQRDRRRLLGAGGIGALSAAGGWSGLTSVQAQTFSPEALRVLEERDTPFGRIAAVERGRIRYLAYGPGRHAVYQSVTHLDRPLELEAPYTRLMMLGAVYAQPYNRMVHVGVGAGNMTGYAIRTFPSATVDAIDIDADVVELGQRYFGLKPDPRLRIHIDDGRRWLAGSTQQFDVIMLDAYDDKSIPAPLMDAPFFKIVAARLAPGGAVMQNVFIPIVNTNRLLAAMRQSFQRVDVYKVDQSAVLAAYQGPQRSVGQLKARAEELDASLKPAHRFEQLLGFRTRALSS